MYHLNGLLTVCGKDLVYTPDDGGETVTCTDAVADSKKAVSYTHLDVYKRQPMMPVARRSSVSRATLCWMASRGCLMATS